MDSNILTLTVHSKIFLDPIDRNLCLSIKICVGSSNNSFFFNNVYAAAESVAGLKTSFTGAISTPSPGLTSPTSGVVDTASRCHVLIEGSFDGDDFGTSRIQ